MTATTTAAVMPELARPVARKAWIDNLRVWLIIGVITAHVGTAYVIDDDWYYVEHTAGAVTELVAWTILGVGALFGMGLLFLVAGLLTPHSLARKGPRRFAVDRLLRLGIPLAVFVFVIDLITDFVGYRAMGGVDTALPYVARWWREDADLGPAWFIATLLVFSLVYAALRTRRPAPARDGRPLRGHVLIGAAAVIAIATFLMRLVWPFLSDAVFGLNLWEFPQMVALFTLGVVAAERGWFDEPVPDRLLRRCGLAALAGGVALTVGLAAAMRGDAEAFLGGMRPQALGLPVVEGIIAVGMSVWVLEWFRRRWNHAGHLGRALGRASYAAYLIHPPVVVAFSLMLRAVPVPAEVKFVVVTAAAVPGAFAVGWLLTRWRATARIL